MKKLLLWAIGGVVGIFVLLLAIGMMASGDGKDSREARKGAESSASQEKSATKAAVAAVDSAKYAPDQCLDGICIGAAAGELARLSWKEKDVVNKSDLNEMQRELLDGDEQAHVKKCLSRNSDVWGSKSQAMCKLLALGASNSQVYQYRPIQVAKVLSFFTEQTNPVCQYYDNETVRVVGHLPTSSGYTKAEFRFDAQGGLRVYEVSKAFESVNSETNSAIAAKLAEKHPYVTNPTFQDNRGLTDRSGNAPWGGSVRIEKRENQAPLITMTAKASEFDSTQLAACKQVKAVSVQ